MHRLRGVERQAVTLGIAAHDRQIMILIDNVEAEAQPEAVCERELVVDRIARVDRIFLLMNVARDEMAAVRRYHQPRIGRPRLRAAFEQRP